MVPESMAYAGIVHPCCELVRLPLVRGSAQRDANGSDSIIDGLGCVRGADVG
jgi:hypothetical protein